METFILGGTGFLGYYATLELLRRGHSVHTLFLLPAPPEMTAHQGNFDELTDQAVQDLFSGCDAVVLQRGASDQKVVILPDWILRLGLGEVKF